MYVRFEILWTYMRTFLRELTYLKTVKLKVLIEKNLTCMRNVHYSLVDWSNSRALFKHLFSVDTHKRHNILSCNCCLSSGGPLNEFKRDPNALLFSLVNPSGSEPNKMNAKAGFDTGIYCGPELGPCFSVRGRHSLKIDAHELPYSFKCQVFDKNLGFQCPANVDFKTYFTGSNSFIISKLEVFKVDF